MLYLKSVELVHQPKWIAPASHAISTGKILHKATLLYDTYAGYHHQDALALNASSL